MKKEKKSYEKRLELFRWISTVLVVRYIAVIFDIWFYTLYSIKIKNDCPHIMPNLKKALYTTKRKNLNENGILKIDIKFMNPLQLFYVYGKILVLLNVLVNSSINLFNGFCSSDLKTIFAFSFTLKYATMIVHKFTIIYTRFLFIGAMYLIDFVNRS